MKNACLHTKESIYTQSQHMYPDEPLLNYSSNENNRSIKDKHCGVLIVGESSLTW